MGDSHELHSISSDQIGLQENIIHRSTSSDGATDRNRHSKKAFILAGFIVVLGIGCLAAGVLLIVLSQSFGQKSLAESKNKGLETPTLPCNKTDANSSTSDNNTKPESPCDFSLEANRAGLSTFLNKVAMLSQNFTPYNTFIRGSFQPYNPIPARIKELTDRTRQLYGELLEMKGTMNISRLKLRETRLLSLVEHHVKHYFGNPYQGNYYTGAWMLGPSQRCMYEPIASLQSHLNLALYVFLAMGNKRVTDAEDFLHILPQFREGIERYGSNLQRGVKSGMVRSTKECAQGIDCLRRSYPAHFVTSSAKNISRWYGSSRVHKFVSVLSPTDLSEWTKKHGKNISDSLLDGMANFVGAPLISLFKYLENDHLIHCVPSNVSSGLGTRPVDHIYVNGTKTLEKTNQTLADGEKIMSGSKAYESVLAYFTTTNHTADEVYDLGWKQLTMYYRQAVDVAKEITKQANESEAVAEFKVLLSSFKFYLNKKQFPANESYQNCRSEKAAALNCPQRYSTMKRWIDVARSTVAQLQPKLIKLFHMTGDKRTVPTCPIELTINFSPSIAVATYSAYTSSCRFAARYRLPFFIEKMGSEAMEWTTGAHEAIPGHHLQLQSYKEIFNTAQCPDIVRVGSMNAFKEGWATYAESPLMSHDSDLYKGQPLRRYGMIKSQIWRALRLVIDTGLHYKNMSRDQALSIFKQYMWDDSDVIEKEVSRYQAWPGQATAYMIGQLEIWRMRNESEAKLGGKFDIRDFHYHVLSQGEVPLWFLDDYINKFYVNCVLRGVSNSNSAVGCTEVSGTHSLHQKTGKKSR